MIPPFALCSNRRGPRNPLSLFGPTFGLHASGPLTLTHTHTHSHTYGDEKCSSGPLCSRYNFGHAIFPTRALPLEPPPRAVCLIANRPSFRCFGPSRRPACCLGSGKTHFCLPLSGAFCPWHRGASVGPGGRARAVCLGEWRRTRWPMRSAGS